MDRRAWRATVRGVTKSRTQLKQLSMQHVFTWSFSVGAFILEPMDLVRWTLVHFKGRVLPSSD